MYEILKNYNQEMLSNFMTKLEELGYKVEIVNDGSGRKFLNVKWN